MNIKENILEGLRSIKSNLLRTVLTSAIITFGIMALVGILTAIESMQGAIDKSFEGMGVNSFDFSTLNNSNRRVGGVAQKAVKPIYFREAMEYKERFSKSENAIITIYSTVSGAEVIKYRSEKSNPNNSIIAADENFIGLKGYKIIEGRNLTETDRNYGSKVAVIGFDVSSKFFPNGKAVGNDITFLNDRFTIVGVLDKKGSMTGGNDDRSVLIPLEVGRNFDTNGAFAYMVTTSAPNATDIDEVMAEGTNVMRQVRGDKPYEVDSFKVERADAMLGEFNEVTGYMRIGGFGISFITLLGASIALMNIMMVSVTERTREIGIRKALGATPGKIRFQFLMEAIVICIIGGVAGVILGIAAGNIVSLMMSGGEGSFTVPWNWIIMGLIVCIIVGLVSGYFPAHKASKMDPIESLRYE
jgi:putative ABC transport system permease protein